MAVLARTLSPIPRHLMRAQMPVFVWQSNTNVEKCYTIYSVFHRCWKCLRYCLKGQIRHWWVHKSLHQSIKKKKNLCSPHPHHYNAPSVLGGRFWFFPARDATALSIFHLASTFMLDHFFFISERALNLLSQQHSLGLPDVATPKPFWHV